MSRAATIATVAGIGAEITAAVAAARGAGRCFHIKGRDQFLQICPATLFALDPLVFRPYKNLIDFAAIQTFIFIKWH